jgi:hypothetical protein
MQLTDRRKSAVATSSSEMLLLLRIGRESSLATNGRILTRKSVIRRSLESRNRVGETVVVVVVDCLIVGHLRSWSRSLTLAILVCGRILLGLSASPNTASAVFEVTSFVDDGSEGNGVDEVTLRSAVANSIEVVVSTVADDTAIALKSASFEDEVAGDFVGGRGGVGRSNSEHFTGREGVVENVVRIGPGIVDVDVVSLSVIEFGVDELAGSTLVASGGGGILGVEVGAELEVLDLGIGRIIQRGHGDDVFMRDGVESDVVEGVDFSVSCRVAVCSIASGAFFDRVVVIVRVVVIAVVR